MSVTRKLAEFTSSLNYIDIPADVVEHLKLLLLDTLGNGFYGSKLPWGQKLIKAIQSMSLNQDFPDGVSIFGHDGKFAPDHAALINGTLIHSFEFDDLHKTAVIHPGAEVIPVLLALSEHLINKGETVTGKQFITALAVGYEVGCQVGMETGAEQLNKGFHPSATSGVFGAAAAGAKLLNLSFEQTLHTLGIAGTQASGLMSAQYEAMVKRMNPGKSAQSGVLSALLAAQDFTGITNVIEAEYGGFARVFAGKSIENSHLNDLGNKYEILNVGFKPYPCCGSNHTTIDSIIEILNEYSDAISVDLIDKVEIESTTATKHHVGWDYKPSGVIAAQMNLTYAAAVTLIDKVCTVDQYSNERIEAEDVNNFISKITVKVNEEFDKLGREGRHQIRLKITLKSGEVITKEKKHAKGSMFLPLTKDEVQEKFIHLATSSLFNKRESTEVLENIMNVDNLHELNAFLNQFKTAILRG